MYFFKATLILACTLVHIAIHQIRHSLSELQFFFPNLVISLFLSNRQIFTKNGNRLFSIHQIRHCPPSFLSKFGYFSFSIKPPNIYKKCQKIVFYSSDSSLSSPPRPRRAPFFFPCLRRFMKFSKDASLSNGINNLNSFYKNENKKGGVNNCQKVCTHQINGPNRMEFLY